MIVVFLSSCSKDEWTGFAYPYWVSSESTWEIQWGFSDLKECRDWVDWVLPSNSVADYECGKNCRFDTSYGINICEETVR